MSTPVSQAVSEALHAIIEQPSLRTARTLEEVLRANNFERQVFGRVNQKSSIEAASESDRGIVERMANAFDASHHGKIVLEFSRKLFSRALLPEFSTRLCVEVRLDNLCDAAIGRVSREFDQTRRDRELLNEVQTTLVWLLSEDDDLRQLKAIAEAQKSVGASLQTSARMTEFLATFAQ